MDVPKLKTASRWKRSPWVLGLCALVVLIVLTGSWLSGPLGERKVKRSELLLGTVQRGEMQIAVDGYGILRSDKQVLIAAVADATVQNVLLRPGAKVEEDSVILQLSNPDLLREVELAGIAVAQEQADLRRLAMSNTRDLLAEQSVLAELRSNHHILHLRNVAQKELALGGVISKLDYQTAQLQEELMLERTELQRKRIEQLTEAAKESQVIKREEINRATSRYQSAQQRVESLTVRAGLKGTLQRMPAELGQSVRAGQELALVGSDADLLALIQVSQSRVDRLQVGQTAEINTRREKVAGVVARIAPEVRDGTIEVEIKFTRGVPASARPELNVDARIFTARLPDALYIERPSNVQSNSSGALFQLQADGKAARLRKIKFGEESGRYIQLLSGAKAQDRFIISDISDVRDVEEIVLLN